MSRFTAIIRIPDAGELVERIECDHVSVDNGGDLHLRRNQRSGDDLLTVGRFQHGHWASYELEPVDVDEELCTGRMTHNQYRDSIGERRVEGDCADAPVKAEALPEVGDTVHVWRVSGEIAGCCPMRVAGRCANQLAAGLALEGPLPWSPEFKQLLTCIHDETRTEHGSWHWPCDGQDVEPEPKPAPNITINVSGSVLSDVIQQQINKQFRAARGRYGTYRR